MKTLLKLASSRTTITIAGVALLILMSIAYTQAQLLRPELKEQFCVAPPADRSHSYDILLADTRCSVMTETSSWIESPPGYIRPCEPNDEGSGVNQVASCQPEGECPPPSKLWLCFGTAPAAGS